MSYFQVKVFAIHCLVQFNSVYFLFNFSVIFTQLIFSLCSLKSGQHSLKRGLCKLRVFKTFLLISSVNTWLNITNCWLICTVYLGLLTLVCFYVKGGGGCWGYISIYENTFKKLLHLPPNSCLNFTQWFKEGHSWSISRHIVKASVRATYANTSSSHVH